MLTQENMNLIQAYFDGDLELENEIELFHLLADNSGAREFLRKLEKMRNEIRLYKNSVTSIRKYSSAPGKVRKSYKSLFYLSAAASIILFVLLTFKLQEQPSYDKYFMLKEELSNIKIDKQSKINNYENFEMELYTINQKLIVFDTDINSTNNFRKN